MKSIICVLGILFAMTAFADDMVDAGQVKHDYKKSLGYSDLSFHDRKSEDSSHEQWGTMEYGPMKFSTEKSLKKYSFNLGTSLGELIPISFMKHVEIEGRVKTGTPSYGLLGGEIPAVGHTTVFIALEVNENKDVRIIGGPVQYWGDNYTMLLLYPPAYNHEHSWDKSAGITMRNKVKEFSFMDLEIDGYLRIQDGKGYPGFGLGADIGYFYAKTSYVQKWEGTDKNMKSLEFGIFSNL